MPNQRLRTLDFTNGKPSLSTFQLNGALLNNAYTSGNYSAGLVLDQTNSYNRTDLFHASPLSRAMLVGSGASSSCNCPNGDLCKAPAGRTACCPVQGTTNTCGVQQNGTQQCVNADPCVIC